MPELIPDTLNTHGRVQPPRMHETVEAIIHWAFVRSYRLELETRVRLPALESAIGSGHRTGLPGLA